MNKIEQFLLSIIPSNPRDAIKQTMVKFDITRMAVHRHMNKLKQKGLVVQKGTKKTTTYLLEKHEFKPNLPIIDKTYQTASVDESEIWRKDFKIYFKDLPESIVKICQYGFTEMFNNVIDHSSSETTKIQLQINQHTIIIQVADEGVGIFNKISKSCNFEDTRDAILKLHQGKFTTDSNHHSGEGIFFTSRAFDEFTILSNGLFYYKENTINKDWYFENRVDNFSQGTCVTMKISLTSKTQLQDIFNNYSNPETFKFDKTQIRISLGKFQEDTFVSRSQAKRVLNSLTGFENIILDFATIPSVGQGFVDEVFGVYALAHPNVNFQVENANNDIIFMIKRCLANRDNLTNKITFQTT